MSPLLCEAAPGVAIESPEQAGDVPVELDGRQRRPVRQPHRLDPSAPRRTDPQHRQEPDRGRDDESHRPAPLGAFGSSTKVTSLVFPSGRESFRLAPSKPSAETETVTSLSGSIWDVR